MSINFDFVKTLSLLLDSLRYDVMVAIIISSILLFILALYNKKVYKKVIIGINILLIILILYYYFNEVISNFDFTNPINNIYFYMFNSILFLIIIILRINKLKILDYIINSMFLIFIMFSIFMTHYLKNITYIVIFNIYPMIKFGNILMILYYLIILTKLIYHAIIKSALKKGVN